MRNVDWTFGAVNSRLYERCTVYSFILAICLSVWVQSFWFATNLINKVKLYFQIVIDDVIYMNISSCSTVFQLHE